jgi:hypothetical protein
MGWRHIYFIPGEIPEFQIHEANGMPYMGRRYAVSGNRRQYGVDQTILQPMIEAKL